MFTMEFCEQSLCSHRMHPRDINSHANYLQRSLAFGLLTSQASSGSTWLVLCLAPLRLNVPDSVPSDPGVSLVPNVRFCLLLCVVREAKKVQSSPTGLPAWSLSCSLCPSPGSQLPCILGTVEVALQTVLTVPCSNLSGPWLGLQLSFGHLSVLSFSQDDVCQLWPWLLSTLSRSLVLDSTSFG